MRCICYHLIKCLKIKNMQTYKQALSDSNSSKFCRFWCYILSNYTEKTPYLHSMSDSRSAQGIFRHRKTLLKHLAFCFSFSSKHTLCLLCSLWMLQQLWCPLVSIHPQARPCPGQTHCSKYYLYADGIVAFQAPFFMTHFIYECGILLLGTNDKLFK